MQDQICNCGHSREQHEVAEGFPTLLPCDVTKCDCFDYDPAQAREEVGWMPIDLAPKETKILGFIPSDYGAEVVWHDLSEWCCYRGDGVKPTHWMRLPPAP